MTKALRYIGNAAIIGIPARDLTEADLQTYAEPIKAAGGVKSLVERGLYVRIEAVSPIKPEAKAKPEGTKES